MKYTHCENHSDTMGHRSIPIVYSLEDVQTKRINIKTPVKFPHAYTCFELFYEDTFMLYKISSLLVIYREPTSIKLRDVSAKLHTTSQLQHIFDSIIKRIKQHSEYSQLISGKRRFPTIIENCFKIININNEDTVTFDSYGEMTPYTRIQSTDAVSIVLYIKSLWINETSYGFTLRLCQIKRLEPYGIHMELDITRESCSRYPNTHPHTPQPPPPPPPPPTMIRKRTSSDDSNMDSTMKRERPVSIMRPSLIDIIASKRKLKKVN